MVPAVPILESRRGARLAGGGLWLPEPQRWMYLLCTSLKRRSALIDPGTKQKCLFGFRPI